MTRFLAYLLFIGIVIFIPFNLNNSEPKKYANIQKSSVKIKLVTQKEIPKPKVIKKVVKKKPKKKKVIKKKKIIKKVLKRKPVKKVIKKEPKPLEKVEEQKVEPQIIKNEVVEETPTIEQNTNAQEVNQNKINQYYALIYQKIDEYKKYPKKAIRFKQEDSIAVYFVIDKDGFIYDFKILEESEYRSLNKAVKKMFKKMKKIQKPPKDIDTPLEVKVSINFKLTKD